MANKKASTAAKDSLDAKAEEYRSAITQKLNESGERERLKELLRSKLVECGWRDIMKNHCREIIKQRGLDNVTADDLVQELTPKGRAEVPAAVKRIRKYLGTVDTKPEKK